MSKVFVEDTELQDIANAIREKNGTENTYKPSQMGDAIRELSANTNDSTGQCLNITTNKTYSNVVDALNEVSTDDTIQLLENGESSIVSIPNDVVLDLNGYALTVDTMLCNGHIVDNSNDKTGILNIEKDKFLIQKNNLQLPVRNGDGYQFFDVIKFNEIYADGGFHFQPFIDSKSHTLLKNGYESSGVRLRALVKHTKKSNSDCYFVDEYISTFENNIFANVLNSYNASTDKYSQMFSFTFSSTGTPTYAKYYVLIDTDLGVRFYSKGVLQIGEDTSATFDLRNDNWYYEIIENNELNNNELENEEEFV